MILIYIEISKLRRGKPKVASDHVTNSIRKPSFHTKQELRGGCKAGSITIFPESMDLTEYLARYFFGHVLVSQRSSCLHLFEVGFATLRTFNLI